MHQPKTKLQEAQERILSGNEFLMMLGIKELEKPQWSQDPQAIDLLGNAYASRKNYEKAMNTFLKGYHLTQDLHFWGLYGSAKLLVRDQQEEGREILERLIAEEQVSSRFYDNLVRHYLSEGLADDALRVTQKALAKKSWVAVHPSFRVMQVLALVSEDEDKAASVALDVLSLLFEKRIDSFADLPESYADAVNTCIDNMEVVNDAFISLVAEWGAKELASEEAPGEEMSFWDNVYYKEILPGVNAVEHTPLAMAITMDLFEEMEPLRKVATSEVL